MPSVKTSDTVAYDLHVLVARLDAAADRILQTNHGISYRRFLALLALRDLGEASQRALAERLNVAEPSASRMASVLAGEGLVDVVPDPAGGNRRRLTLTRTGARTVANCAASLEGRFADLVARSGVRYDRFALDIRLLVAALEGVPR